MRSINILNRDYATALVSHSSHPYVGTVQSVNGLFQSPYAIAYDSDTNDYIVAESVLGGTFIARVSLNGHATALTTNITYIVSVAYDSASKRIYAGTVNFGQCALLSIAPNTGAIATLAGGGQCGTADGQGSAAQFSHPAGIAVTPDGQTLYVTDGDRVRTVTASGQVTTLTAPGSIGGGSFQCSSGNLYPQGIAYNSKDGNLYIADPCPNVIRRVNPATGKVNTVAGRCVHDRFFDCTLLDANGHGPHALFAEPSGIAFNPVDNHLYIADAFNNQIRRMTTDGDVATLAGSGHAEFVNGIGSYAGFNQPNGLAVLPSGVLYVADTLNFALRTVVSQGPIPPPPAHGVVLYDPPTMGAQPYGITTTSDGSVWYSEWNVGKIARVDSAGRTHEYVLPQNNSPFDLITDPSGNVVFSDEQGDPNFPTGFAIGVITPSGQLSLYPIPSGSLVGNIAEGPDGNAWFVMPQTGALANFATTGTFTEYAVDSPSFVGAGFTGDLWTTGTGFVEEFSTTGSLLRRYLSGSIAPGPIARGPGNRIWFGQPQTVGEVLPHAIALFQLPPAPSQNGQWQPTSITLGPDGAAWIAESNAGILGRITAQGDFTEIEVPTARSAPTRIYVAPNGTMWFTDPSGSKIGRWF